MTEYCYLNNSFIFEDNRLTIKLLLLTILLIMGYKILLYIINKIQSKFTINRWSRIAKDIISKRNAASNTFYDKYKNEFKSRKEIIDITKLSIEQLSIKIKLKQITSRKAYLCYALNSATVGLKLNSLAYVDFEYGLKMAEKADETIEYHTNNYIKTNNNLKSTNINDLNLIKYLNKVLPALIGVPMSIKDHIPIKNFIDSCGYISKAYFDLKELEKNNLNREALIITKLKSLGIIPICKSNVVQGLMAAETSNNLWGSNYNVFDLTRTTGGSSGGEGSLISCYCSPLGLGSDIAGSIRIPSNFNGVYGFKPTSNKFPTAGVLGVDTLDNEAWKVWEVSLGFISRNLEDIVYLSKLIYGSFDNYNLVENEYNINNNNNTNKNLQDIKYNHECVNLDHRQFNTKVYNSKHKLKIGYVYNYSELEIIPEIKESIKYTINNMNKVNNSNHEFIEINLENYEDLFYMGYEMIFNSFAINELILGLKGEKHSYFYNEYFIIKKLPIFVIKLLKYIMKIFGENRISKLLGKLEIHTSVDHNLKRASQFFKLKKEFLNDMYLKGIDAILLPVYPTPAPKLGNAEITNSTTFFNMLISMIDMPSLAIPSGLLVTEHNKLNKTNVLNYTYKSKFNDKLGKLVSKDLTNVPDIPIGFQIAALPGMDELALRVGREVNNTLNNDEGRMEFINNLDIENNKTRKFFEYRNI